MTGTCNTDEVEIGEGSPTKSIPNPTPRGEPSLVVIAIRTLRVSGAESLACYEAAQLAEAGYEVEVWYQIDGPFRARLAKAGVRAVRVPLWSGRRRIRSVGRRSKDHLVMHTHSPSSGAMLRLVSLGIPNVTFIHTEHNVAAAYHPVARLLHRLMAWRIEELVAVSKAVGETAPPTRRNRVLKHVDLTLPRIQACLGLPMKVAGPLRLVCVASLTPKKDHANLLAALIILDRLLDAQLQVSLVGDGPLRIAITAQAAVLNRGCTHVTVEMLGHRNDVPAILKDADVLVLASIHEGMPLVLFEAMAASTPIVATDVGGVAECCDNGLSGVLVPPGDAAALAGALHSVLSDPCLREQLAVGARTQLCEQAGHRWLDTYLQMIERLKV